MKRSLEIIQEEEVDVKKINLSLNSSSDSETSDTEELDLSTSDLNLLFVPSPIEKQIVRSSLAMICRANSSDWNCEIHQHQADTMVLHEKTVVLTNSIIGQVYEVITEVCYREEDTYCRVLYRNTDLGEKDYSTVLYMWDNDVNNDMIYLVKHEIEKYYLVFSRDVMRSLSVVPTNCRDDSWCYFRDVRSHLDSISL